VSIGQRNVGGVGEREGWRGEGWSERRSGREMGWVA